MVLLFEKLQDRVSSLNKSWR